MTDEPGSSPASIEVAMPDAAWNACMTDAEAIVTRVAEACLRRALPAAATGRSLEVSIVLTDDSQVRALNGRHRGQDKATNVLSFPAVDWQDASGRGTQLPNGAAPLLLGDVIVARETLLAEAALQGKTPGDHLSHLVAHGVLHLMGYDHEDDASATVMEALEVSILEALGVADPYAAQQALPSTAMQAQSQKERRR